MSLSLSFSRLDFSFLLLSLFLSRSRSDFLGGGGDPLRLFGLRDKGRFFSASLLSGLGSRSLLDFEGGVSSLISLRGGRSLSRDRLRREYGDLLDHGGGPLVGGERDLRLNGGDLDRRLGGGDLERRLGDLDRRRLYRGDGDRRLDRCLERERRLERDLERRYDLDLERRLDFDLDLDFERRLDRDRLCLSAAAIVDGSAEPAFRDDSVTTRFNIPAAAAGRRLAAADDEGDILIIGAFAGTTFTDPRSLNASPVILKDFNAAWRSVNSINAARQGEPSRPARRMYFTSPAFVPK